MKLPLTVALVATLAVSLDPGGWLDSFELRTVDARHRHFARPTPFTERIVILDITEESIERLSPLYGRWPWPRALHGEVVEYLANDGASAVGFDLLFPEPALSKETSLADWNTLAALAQSADLAEVREELIRRIDALQPGAGDQEFADAVRKAGNVFQASVIAGEQWIVPPFPELARASHGMGHINVLPDADGVYRRFQPFVSLTSTSGASWALGIAMAAHVRSEPLSAQRQTPGGLAFGKAILPLLPDGSARIHYQGGDLRPLADGNVVFHSYYRHIPYEHVLAAKDLRATGQETPLPVGTFKDKIVLVSAQAAGLSDLRATPFSPVTPGIEIHANIIDSLLAGKFLNAPNRLATFLIMLSACMVAALAAQRARFRLAVPLFVTAVAGYASGSWIAFGQGWLVPIVPSIIAMTLAYGSVLLVRAIVAEKEKRWLRTAFGHYLAPNVLNEVLRSPDKLRLGGERRTMTVLFSDIAGFTTFSEKLPPEEVGMQLNGYLDRMTACLSETGGTLDKFIGDAVMAEWNAPLTQPDHAALACATALRMLEEAGDLGEAWRRAGGALDIRIGINTGEMIVGNMGSHQVFDYTAIGNEVNTASRLEPLNKVFGTRVIVSGATRRDAETWQPGRFVFRALGRVTLKGRDEPIEVHELFGRQASLDAAERASLETFADALDRYVTGHFDMAQTLFRKVLEQRPGDGPTALFIGLCEDFRNHPPASDWDGSFQQTEK